MAEVSDMELLRVYDRQGSEEAFAELVRRHINLVYSAAFRQVANSAHAAEITQTVFVILVRKAAGLRPDTVLEGWLYETTRLTSLSFLRGERRRQLREQEAYMQSTLSESGEAMIWQQLSPLLDEAMSRLGKKDREAVVLRYFKDKNLCEVAAALKVTESAAQRRVHRAVEKLRLFFMKRGVSSTAVIIAGAISANAVAAAPAGMAANVIAVATVKGGIVSASTLTLIKGTLKLIAWTKAKTSIAVGAIALLAAGTATVVVTEIQKPQSADQQTPQVEAFKKFLSSPACFSSIVYSQSRRGGPSETYYGGVCDNTNFFLAGIKGSRNFRLPISYTNSHFTTFYVGRFGDTWWQIAGYSLSLSIRPDETNPDPIAGFSDGAFLQLGEVLNLGSQHVVPGSFV